MENKEENEKKTELSTTQDDKPAIKKSDAVNLSSFNLSPKEKCFISNFLDCGGDLTESAVRSRPDLYLQENKASQRFRARQYGYDLFHRPKVREAIDALLDASISHESIIDTYDFLRRQAEKEETKLKANNALAEITGLIGQKDNQQNAPVVVVQIPCQASFRPVEPIDVVFSEEKMA